MISRISKGYWIWGQFDPESTREITSLYQDINNKLYGPSFDVHLTLSGPFLYQQSLHEPIFNSLPSRFSKFKIQLDGIGYKDEFFQSLFLNVAESQDLINLKALIDKSFKLKGSEYFPHISLFYGMVDSISKNKIIKESKPPRQALLDKISVVKVDEEIKSWEVLKSYHLP